MYTAGAYGCTTPFFFLLEGQRKLDFLNRSKGLMSRGMAKSEQYRHSNGVCFMMYLRETRQQIIKNTIHSNSYALQND